MVNNRLGIELCLLISKVQVLSPEEQTPTCHLFILLSFFNPHLTVFLLILERDKHRCKRKTSIRCLLLAP